MNNVRPLHRFVWRLAFAIACTFAAQPVFAQSQSQSMNGSNGNQGRPVVIPLTIKINARQLDPETERGDLLVLRCVGGFFEGCGVGG
jgi:hypothetical protein